MFTRVTSFEIDTLRTTLDTALGSFKELVAPVMREQEGYRGAYVLATQEGKGLLLTFWESAEAAQSGVESGYYAEQVAKLMTVFRSPPGREHYQVLLAEPPGAAEA